jgi:hypothetical protein
MGDDKQHFDGTPEAKLPWHDWILLPMLGLLTICLIAVAVELIATRMYPSQALTQEVGSNGCVILNDTLTGARGFPNTACKEKIGEGELTEYVFNRCGDRAGEECGPKPEGTYRIVMIGSSFTFGYRVPMEKSFAALLPAKLSRRTGLKIDLYNKGMEWETPRVAELRMNSVIAMKPDMIFWVVSPWDIQYATLLLPDQVPAANARSFASKVKYRIEQGLAKPIPDAFNHISQNVLRWFRSTHSAILLLHVLYSSRVWYVRSYLTGGEDTEYLRSNSSAQWQNSLKEFDGYATQIVGQAKAAKVPVVVTLVPFRPQAAMLSMGKWPVGYDPYKLDDDLRAMFTNQGETYIDILPGFRDIPDSERGFLIVDGHPNAYGNAIFSELMAKGLANGAVSALSDNRQASFVQGK